MAADRRSAEVPLGPEAIFAQALDQGHFKIQRCQACRKHVFYPRLICPHCGADDLEWLKPSGWGVVYSTTVVRRKPAQGGDYNIALIDLEEGPRLMSRVEGIDPSAVRIGLKVRARLVKDDDGRNLLVFVPEGHAKP
jgi:uncharacterized OB-fold protein